MKEILSYLKKLLYNGDMVVVATSGGPDSMCLLNLLCKTNAKIIVAHVNHKLRIESEEEAEFVKNFASSHNLIYEYMEIKEYNHDNLENAARQKRYAFFKSLITKYHAKYLMTAHHGDDLMETILMRLTRGSSLKGYSGFHKVVEMESYKIIRPLITLTKSDIIKYMDTNNYKYYIDESNYSKEITRVRYRLDCLPFFKNENKNVHLKFLKFSEELDKASIFIDKYITKLIKDLECKNGISIKKLQDLDDFLIEKVIEHLLSIYYPNDLFLISDKHKKLVIDLIYSSKSNLTIDLPNNIIAIKEYDVLKLDTKRKEQVYKYEFIDEIHTPSGVIKKISSSSQNSNYILRLNSKKLKLPLIIRNRYNGDKMEIKNLGGSKKVKDILIDSKISKEKRKTIPVVTDSENNVLWLPGVKKSKFDVESNEIYDIILLYEEE